jgi:GTP1/Obg family GTP-binding protein
MNLDTPKLTEAISLCFENSKNNELPAAERARFLFQGKQLRGHLLNLLTAQFDAELDAEVAEANKRLSEVVKQLKKDVDDLAKVKEQLAELRGIAKLLETLVKGAASFV